MTAQWIGYSVPYSRKPPQATIRCMRSVGLVTLGFIIGAIFVIVVLIKACQFVF